MVCTTVRGMPVFRPAQCSHAYARAHTTIPLSPTALFEKLLTLDFAAVLDQRISKIGAFLFAPCRFPHHHPPSTPCRGNTVCALPCMPSHRWCGCLCCRMRGPPGRLHGRAARAIQPVFPGRRP